MVNCQSNVDHPTNWSHLLQTGPSASNLSRGKQFKIVDFQTHLNDQINGPRNWRTAQLQFSSLNANQKIAEIKIITTWKRRQSSDRFRTDVTFSGNMTNWYVGIFSIMQPQPLNQHYEPIYTLGPHLPIDRQYKPIILQPKIISTHCFFKICNLFRFV